jgi:copper transport protein
MVISPALSGHASLEDPSAVLVPANALHVLAMSAWVAGLVLLLFVLPRATRVLGPPDRTRLLASTLARFSPLAFVAVLAILVTGLMQAWFQVEELDNLLDTAFGRSVLIKFGLLVGPLMALGAYNQRRLLPRLRRAAASGATPGRDGILLRRSIRTEVALLAVVLGVTAALVSYAPSGAVSSGPQSKTASLGPADLQLTVDPARVGPNQMHVYLTDKQTGSQYDRVKEMSVALVLPAKKLGPLKVEARKAGPGHYVMNGALFGVAGDWEVKVTARVSEFDAYFATLKVGID